MSGRSHEPSKLHVCTVLSSLLPACSQTQLYVVVACRQALTIAVWAGIGPVALAGAYAAYQRQRFFKVTVANRFG